MQKEVSIFFRSLVDGGGFLRGGCTKRVLSRRFICFLVQSTRLVKETTLTPKRTNEQTKNGCASTSPGSMRDMERKDYKASLEIWRRDKRKQKRDKEREREREKARSAIEEPFSPGGIHFLTLVRFENQGAIERMDGRHKL